MTHRTETDAELRYPGANRDGRALKRQSANLWIHLDRNEDVVSAAPGRNLLFIVWKVLTVADTLLGV